MSYLKITYNIKKNKILRNRESYKILMKEIKEDTNNGKTSHVHELEDSVLLKCP